MSAEEIKEVIEYLKHSNPQVKQEACKILTQLCASPSTFTALASVDVIPSLLPLISFSPPLQTSALTLLLLLSTSDALLPSLLSSPTISTCIELLRTSPSPPPPSTLPILQLIVNLSRDSAGAKQLMQEGTAIEGLHLRRVLSWFTLPPFPSDPYQHIASILLNLTQLPSARQWILTSSSIALASLPRYILSDGEVRQRDILTLFRNLFLDSSAHPVLLLPVYGILERVLLLLAGEGEVREEEREGFFPSVLQAMHASHPRHPNASIRRLCLEIITLCAREKRSRAYLKEKRVYTVLRELHMKHEKDPDKGSKELDEMLYEIVPYFILPEDEKEMEEDRRRRPAQIEVMEEGKEEKKERVREREPVKVQNEWVMGDKHVEEEEEDEKTAALLSDLSLSSKAVETEIQQKREEAEKEAAAAAAEKAKMTAEKEEIYRQMESRERVDDRLLDNDDNEEDEIPELIEENAADVINEMD